MAPALKSEFRKFVTVRSTYILVGLTFAIVSLFDFYVSGWRANKADLLNPHLLAGNAAVMFAPIILGLAVILQLTHEYRYGTINYSLTDSNSRVKLLLAKTLVASALGLLFTAVFGVLGPLLITFGIHAHGLTLVHQTFPYATLVWRDLFFGWGVIMAGFVIAALIRNQIGAIVTFLIVPTTIENLLGLLLKKDVVYLPFSALNAVIGQEDYPHSITSTHAAMVASAYLVTGWLVACVLFVRRDA